jgi:hypothetical protein
MVSKRRRYDLREFWPWYERSVSLPPGAGHATPPPFALADAGEKEQPAKRRTEPARRVRYLLWLIAGVALLAFLIRALLH